MKRKRNHKRKCIFIKKNQKKDLEMKLMKKKMKLNAYKEKTKNQRHKII